MLIDDHLTYYAEHFYAGLRNDPFGIGASDGDLAFTQTTFVEGGYNSRPFAIGLALGFTSVYGDLQEMFEITSSDDAGGSAEPWEPGRPELGPWTQDMQHAFAVGQRVRLGAMDGLNLLVSNTLLYFPGGGELADGEEATSGFIWGGTSAKLTIPLAQRADLFVEGGGGVMGYAYARSACSRGSPATVVRARSASWLRRAAPAFGAHARARTTAKCTKTQTRSRSRGRWCRWACATRGAVRRLTIAGRTARACYDHRPISDRRPLAMRSTRR